MTPTARRNTRQSGAGLKILSAGSTLYGVRACAEMFGRERGIPVQVATDHAITFVRRRCTVAALRNALLAADAVLLTRAPTGDHLMQAIARVGVAEAIADKLQRFDTSTLLNRHLADRADTAAIGFGPVTEIKSWHGKGVVYAGAIPDEMQIVLPYGAAVLRRTQERELAHALLAFLATSAAREQFLASGVE